MSAGLARGTGSIRGQAEALYGRASHGWMASFKRCPADHAQNRLELAKGLPRLLDDIALAYDPAIFIGCRGA